MAAIAVSYSGLLGGAERVLVEAASGLEEPPLIACPPGPLAEAARGRGVGVFELRERSLELRRSPAERVAAAGRLAAQAAELRALFGSVRPDTVVAWGMRAALSAFPAAAPGTRLILQHHDLLPGPLIARTLRRRARRAELVVVPSHCVARDLDPRGELGGRLRVVNPGVDPERFRPPRAPVEEQRVLLLGAVEPWKRPDLALEAVALAARELPGLGLTVAGEPVGAEGERLLAELRGRVEGPDLRGRVTFTGRVDDPERLLASSACLLHCAEREPYGMVVAEALACGLPVVAPDSCGPAELVERDYGRLYPPGDAEAAARALTDVLRDPAARAQMGAAARTRAERDLDVAAMRAAYAGLLGGRPAERRPGAGLAVVTVLHDSAPELARLLDSVERHLPEAQLVVVDSGS